MSIRTIPYAVAALTMFDIVPPFSTRRTNRPWGSITVPTKDLEAVTKCLRCGRDLGECEQSRDNDGHCAQPEPAGAVPELSTEPIDSGPPRLLNPILTPAMEASK